MQRTGAQLIWEVLTRLGVDTVFGYPGGAIMPFYHALWEYRDELRHVLCRHEQGAGHAAEAVRLWLESGLERTIHPQAGEEANDLQPRRVRALKARL